MKYLFLVPDEENESWQVATRDGKVVITEGTRHFSGRMPLIIAGKYFLEAGNFYDLEENLPKFEGV